MKEHARRTVQLGDDDPLGAVDDEGAGVGHQGQFTHVDFLLLDVLDGLVLATGFLVVNDQAHQGAQGRSIGHAAQLALLDIEGRGAQPVAHILQRRIARIALDGKHRGKGGMQPLVLALVRILVELQEIPVRLDLGRQQVRDL